MTRRPAPPKARPSPRAKNRFVDADDADNTDDAIDASDASEASDADDADEENGFFKVVSAFGRTVARGSANGISSLSAAARRRPSSGSEPVETV